MTSTPSPLTMTIVAPSRNGAVLVAPRNIRMPDHSSGSPCGCSCPRTTEWMPSAPTRKSADSVAADVWASTPPSCSSKPVNPWPVRTADGPSRSRTADSRIACRRPRWTESWGWRWPPSMPRGSRNSRRPRSSWNSIARGATAASATSSATPRRSSSATARGSRLMPTPSGRSSAALFDDGRVDAVSVQGQRRGEPADPGSRDEDRGVVHALQGRRARFISPIHECA